MFRLHKLFILFLGVQMSVFAQDNVGYGVSLAYNFPIKTTGFGLRASIPLSKRWLIVPQVKYFPANNIVHEVYGGVNIHFLLWAASEAKGYHRSLINPKKPQLYLSTGVEYNYWINYISTVNTAAKQNNILPEAGIGISIGSLMLRGFAEAKYNILWNESHGELGVMVYPSFFGIKTKNKCPK